MGWFYSRKHDSLGKESEDNQWLCEVKTLDLIPFWLSDLWFLFWLQCPLSMAFESFHLDSLRDSKMIDCSRFSKIFEWVSFRFQKRRESALMPKPKALRSSSDRRMFWKESVEERQGHGGIEKARRKGESVMQMRNLWLAACCSLTMVLLAKSLDFPGGATTDINGAARWETRNTPKAVAEILWRLESLRMVCSFNFNFLPLSSWWLFEVDIAAICELSKVLIKLSVSSKSFFGFGGVELFEKRSDATKMSSDFQPHHRERLSTHKLTFSLVNITFRWVGLPESQSDSLLTDDLRKPISSFSLKWTEPSR